MERLKRAARVILIGAPGVGKGTQTSRLLQQFPQLSGISSGDLLRRNVRLRTAFGIQAEAIIKAGSLVPDSTILRLILNEFTSRGWLRAKSRTPYTLDSTATNFSLDLHQTDDSFITGFAPDEEVYRYSDDPSASFVLDGFPRTVSQAGLVDDLIPINLVVNIKTPTSIILDRIANRWVHEPSGRVYNTTFNAPKIAHIDDVTGDPLTRRTDDGLETWKIRLLNFEKTSTPLLEHYEKQGILWTVEGKSSDEITPQLLAEMDRRFGRV